MASAAPGTATADGLTLVSQHDLDGFGDGMQVMRAGDAVYVGHFGPSGMGPRCWTRPTRRTCGW